MRLGFVVYGLDRPLTGIGRYTFELARTLVGIDGALDLTLLTAGGPGPLATVPGMEQVPLPGCRLLPGLVTLGNAEIPVLARRRNLDIVHDPTGVTPLLLGGGGARTVVTIHDVFAWSCPGVSSLLDTLIYRLWLPRLLPRADAVITVSEHSKRDIERYLGIAPDQIRVIPYGISHRFQPLPRKQIRAQLKTRFDLENPYILFVGNLTLRKNIERALRAFALLVSSYPKLQFVLAGPSTLKKTPVSVLASELGITDRIFLTGPLTDADLPALYSGADLFVFPSLCEGFGLPPLEAMACGTPVVCSNATSLPEVVGDAAITVDPTAEEALARAMHRVLSDRDLQQDLHRRGLKRAAGFTWERAARQTVAVYREVLGA